MPVNMTGSKLRGPSLALLPPFFFLATLSRQAFHLSPFPLPPPAGAPHVSHPSLPYMRPDKIPHIRQLRPRISETQENLLTWESQELRSPRPRRKTNNNNV
ncbi:hypothetical protein FKM82_020359 [Ascaphus truei]